MSRNALLPAYQFPTNAVLDVSGLSNALSEYTQGKRQDERFQYQKTQDTARLGMERERLDMAKGAADYQRRRQQIEDIGNLSVAADNERDPIKRAQLHNAIIARHPDAANLDPIYRDPMQGPRLLRAEAGKARDALDEEMKRAQIGVAQAQVRNLNRREEPEVVRTMRAAGVDPQSDQGRQLILNSIKGGDPISQAVGGAIQQQFAPQAQQQSPIRPQSYSPAGDQSGVPRNALAGMDQGQGGEPPAGIVLAQSGQQTAPQQAPTQRQDMVTTPLGPMPREKAALLGFGIAMSGKGEAGKMFGEAASAGQLGKEGQNDLDKKMIAASDNLANLVSIKQQFRPEFQQIESRAGMAWNAFRDRFKSGKGLDDNQKSELAAFEGYKADSLDAMNTYIKAITGAAMTDSEAKRILGALPSVGESWWQGDGPTAFKSKLDTAMRKTTLAIARHTYAKQNGKDWQFMGLSQMERLVTDEAKAAAQQLQRQGVPPAQIKPQVQQYMKQKFGVDLDI